MGAPAFDRFAAIDRAPYQEEGFPEVYDRYRPRPPEALLDLLGRVAGERPRLVVDLGSGTGLSTHAWSDRADEIVGVEPNPNMRSVASAEGQSLGHIRFVEAVAQKTGLADGAADVVTASQSFHWMDPESTLAEVARILRPGGVLGVYDHEWPPSVAWEAEAAFDAVRKRLGLLPHLVAKEQHLERILESGRFRFVRELWLHGEDEGNAERFVGLALSLGPIAERLAEGASEAELGLTALREVAARAIGDEPKPWLWSYRLRLAVL